MNKYKRWGVIAAAVFAVMLLAGLLFPMTFYLNDDVTLRNIMSGAYTGSPDGHAVYMEYPLTGLISLMYRLNGSIPWFSVFMTGFIWLSSVMVLGTLSDDAGDMKKNGVIVTIAAGILCAAFFLPQMIYLHYTLCAAILGSCGLFLAAMGKRGRSVVLFVLCYCVRTEVFSLMLPFLFVVVLRMLWEEKNIKTLLEPLLLAVCILCCMGLNSIMYSSDDWRQYKAVNDSRTQLYDYGGVLPYEENRDRYEKAGISKEEHVILEQYALVLDDGADENMMRAASEVYTEKLREERDEKEYFRFCLGEYKYHILHTDAPYSYILAGAYLLTVLFFCLRKKWKTLILLGCMAAGRSVVWLYLIWRGRFPERVYISLYFLETMTLVGIFCAELVNAKEKEGTSDVGTTAEKRRRQLALQMALGLSAALLLAVGVSQTIKAVSNAASQRETQKEWDALTEYCMERQDCFYLLDVMSMLYYAGNVWKPASKKNNYILTGGWMSRTPLLKERLGQMGADDGGELLAFGGTDGTEIFYVANQQRDITWLSDYLSSRFGEVELKKTDGIVMEGEELFVVYCAVLK